MLPHHQARDNRQRRMAFPAYGIAPHSGLAHGMPELVEQDNRRRWTRGLVVVGAFGGFLTLRVKFMPGWKVQTIL